MSKQTSPSRPQSAVSASSDSNNFTFAIVIIGAFFFIFGFVTWLNSILIPYLKTVCELDGNGAEPFYVTFAFYIAYAVMAIPSAYLLKRTGFKNGMMVGLLIMALGALIFIPAAQQRTYSLFLLGLFVLATGLTILQTASNPYVTILGPKESAAKRISIMGICNKIAGIISPLILASILFKDSDAIIKSLETMDKVQKATQLNELASRIVAPYTLMAVVLVGLAALVRFANLPEIEADEEDLSTSEFGKSNKKSIFEFPHLVMGVIALFLYVGVEVMAGDTIINYGVSKGIPMDTAKTFTSYTLVSMLIGYFLGIALIPKIIKQEKALAYSAILGAVLTVLATILSGKNSVLCIALLGLANALMWPAIWPLAISGLGKFTKIGSSLLIMSIAGGAILPVIYGALSKGLGDNQMAYLLMVPCYLFIWYYAEKGHKSR
jgi:MFS transporter, FHS family, L-fucose permease